MKAIIRSKYFKYINILPIVAILILGYLNQSYFEIACAGCAVLFWLIQLRLSSIINKDEATQRKQCRPVSGFSFFPSVGILAVGILIPFQDYFELSLQGSYTTIALSCVLAVCLALQMITVLGNKLPAGKFMVQTLISALSAPMSLIVVLLLHMTGAEDGRALSCMSAVLFGVMSLLISINMILVSRCNYRSTLESIRLVNNLYKKHKLVFTRISILKDALLVAGKAIISVISVSFFMFVNALYSAGMGVARFVALRMHKQDREKQIESYRLVGIIISISSICYVLYSVRLFFGGKTGAYDMNVALVIALYTFVEFGINIREAIRLRKSKILEAKALRAISFSGTLLCFVLTQTAIMSFAAEGDNSFANALSGVVFGSLAALRGIFVIMDSLRHKEDLLTE